MTKVSKVYFGLSLASLAPGRPGRPSLSRSWPRSWWSTGTGGCSRPAPGSFSTGARPWNVDKSLCRPVGESTCWLSASSRSGAEECPEGGADCSPGRCPERVDSPARAGLMVVPSRISRLNTSRSAPSSSARSRPSTWVRVNSSGTAMIARLSWTVTGSQVASQARWLGWMLSRTARQASLRAGSVCSTRLFAFSRSVLVGGLVRPPCGVVQFCVQVAPAPLSTALSTGCAPRLAGERAGENCCDTGGGAPARDSPRRAAGNLG